MCSQKMTVLRSSLDQDQIRYPLEATLTSETMKYLKAFPKEEVFATKISDRYNLGVSDILACVMGIFVAIELKSDTGKPTKAQTDFVDNTIRSGGIGGVCYCLREVKDLVEAAKRLALSKRKE